MSTQVDALSCEYFENPLGIDVLCPLLSWKLRSKRRGARQSAYQVQVATSEASLQAGKADLWESGRVDSDQSIQVVYAGAAPQSGQRLWWRVRVWDESDAASAYSAPAWWEIGMLQGHDWVGQWIESAHSGGPRTTAPCPFFRKAFALEKPVVSARLYATALGVYEFFFNGRRVGDEEFAPGWTDYRKRVPYQTYDVTALLQNGENVASAILGDGWYCGQLGANDRQNYGDRPRLMAQLIVKFEDGSQQMLATDESWVTATGPILESDIMGGESYDARREMPGWNTAGFDAIGWMPATVFADPGVPLVARRGPAVRTTQELVPIGKSAAKKLIWGYEGSIYDLGQNMVGRVRLKVSGVRGTTVKLRFGEVLDADGALYTDNLRSARAIDYYTFKGDGEEVWEPRFSFHGFRYVEVTSRESIELASDGVVGVVMHSDTVRTGKFECSDALLNQLQSNIDWGWRGNSLEIPTDCPQRDERLGWTGDAQVFVRTAAFNRNVAAFFTKWQDDLSDAQAANGSIPPVVPNILGDDGGPAWGDAVLICPLAIYQVYGDTRLLETHYSSFERYMEFLGSTAKDGIRCYEGCDGFPGHGDWLALDGSGKVDGGTPKDLIGTAFYAYDAALMSRIATILGKNEDAARYARLFEMIRAAFNERYVTASGLVAAQTQTAYVLALHFDLLPFELRAKAAAALVSDITARGTHLSTGFVGSSYLPHVLAQTGHLDTAYALLHQKTWPSWLYAVTQGATTIWERWDGWTPEKGFQEASMNSFNHYAYGAIGEWLYQVVAGIDLDPECPAYKHQILRPHLGGGLTQTKASLDSVYGIIESAWTLDSGRFEWKVVVPPNTTATAYVPAKTSRVFESGQPAVEADGVTLVRQEHDSMVFHLAPGGYHFSSYFA